jgi:ATP-dependent DNA helicase RecQ
VTSPPASADLDPRTALHDLFGYPDFRPGQREVVEAVLAGEDVLAVMPTGAGKSLCYQLPAFLLPGCTVVISPLVALMKDQLDSLPPALRGQAAVFNSSVPRELLDAQTADLVAGRLKLIYVAPERLRQRPFLHALQRAAIARFVVDEAHCISLWGHDFRPDYFFIPEVLALLGHPPVLAMTATATPRLRDELVERLGLRPRADGSAPVLSTGVLRPNLYLEVERVENKEEKLRRLIEICTAEQGAGIVYVSSRENAETVAKVLRQHGINANHYHAGLEPGERARVQDWYMSGRTRVIVATVAFGMGVDKADVRFIVHFNPSRSLEAYAQESGRAGRDGEPARCILFWASSDKASLSKWLREDALSRDTLNAVWRALHRGLRDRFAWWPTESLVAAARAAATEKADEIDETTVRVALGALEQVGLVRRHCDLPEVAQVRLGLNDAGDRLAATLDAAPGNRMAREMFAVAEALDCAPPEVEERLLTLEDERALSYYGTNRGLLIEVLPQPSDLGERLRGLLAGYEAAQNQRVREIELYATGDRRCRTATIARHFGETHPGRCDHCDVCAPRGRSGRGFEDAAVERPSRPAAAMPDRAPEDIILECIAELPFQMGKSGVTKVLKGSVGAAVREDRSRHFGLLAALPASQIEREIDVLVERGYLRLHEREQRDGRRYYALAVTQEGYAKPAAPWPPPRPEPVRRAAVPRAPRSGLPEPEAETLDEDDALVEERFAALKEWRREQVRETGLPAYTVLNDETLRLLAGRRITSLEDIARVKGVGPAKLEKYGAALLSLLSDEG